MSDAMQKKWRWVGLLEVSAFLLADKGGGREIVLVLKLVPSEHF